MTDKIYVVNTEDIEHHRLASEHRVMNQQEFEALKLDIETNGQLVPVILYKNKLVDGRHRQKALLDLGIKDMKAILLPGNISLEDVRSKVMGTEIRRSDNIMQKSIRAYKWIIEKDKRTQQEAAVKFGINQSYISQAKKLFEMLGKDTFEQMYANGYLMINGKKVSTMKSIIKYMSTEEEEPKEYEPTSEMVKTLFQSIQAMHKRGDIVGIAQIEAYARKLRLKEEE